MNLKTLLYSIILLCFFSSAYSDEAAVRRALWANQAIMTIYHYQYDTYIENQKSIAKYFSAEAWIQYTKANIAAQLANVIQQNKWQVRAVPIKPPVLNPLPQKHWKAVMPILIQYKNKEREEYQTVEVSLEFGPAARGTGVYGLAISSIQTKVLQTPCDCVLKQAKNNL